MKTKFFYFATTAVLALTSVLAAQLCEARVTVKKGGQTIILREKQPFKVPAAGEKLLKRVVKNQINVFEITRDPKGALATSGGRYIIEKDTPIHIFSDRKFTVNEKGCQKTYVEVDAQELPKSKRIRFCCSLEVIEKNSSFFDYSCDREQAEDFSDFFNMTVAQGAKISDKEQVAFQAYTSSEYFSAINSFFRDGTLPSAPPSNATSSLPIVDASNISQFCARLERILKEKQVDWGTSRSGETILYRGVDTSALHYLVGSLDPTIVSLDIGDRIREKGCFSCSIDKNRAFGFSLRSAQSHAPHQPVLFAVHLRKGDVLGRIPGSLSNCGGVATSDVKEKMIALSRPFDVADFAKHQAERFQKVIRPQMKILHEDTENEVIIAPGQRFMVTNTEEEVLNSTTVTVIHLRPLFDEEAKKCADAASQAAEETKRMTAKMEQQLTQFTYSAKINLDLKKIISKVHRICKIEDAQRAEESARRAAEYACKAANDARKATDESEEARFINIAKQEKATVFRLRDEVLKSKEEIGFFLYRIEHKPKKKIHKVPGYLPLPYALVGGSNNNGWYLRESDQKIFLIKFTHSTNKSVEELGDIAANEAIAVALYRVMGVKMPSAKVIEDCDGIPGVAIERIVGSPVSSASEMPNLHFVRKSFAVDCFLANWDVIGNFPGLNILRGKNNEAVKIDAGGSLTRRAQGEPKQFSRDVDEFQTFFSQGDLTSNIFSKITYEEFEDGYARVTQLTDEQIEGIVTTSGSAMQEGERIQLVDTLKARRDSMISHKEEYFCDVSFGKENLGQPSFPLDCYAPAYKE